MFARPFTRWIVSLPLTVLMTAPLSAAEAELEEEVARLFAIGWQPSLKARAACSEQFAKLNKMAPVDRRIPYAYALVHIRQHSYPYAARLVSEVLANQSDNLHAWRVKIWLSMLMKEYATAMVEADRVAAVMGGKATDWPGEAGGPQLEMAAFLGRIFGFLEGPASDQVSVALVETSQKKILDRLSEPQREAFEEGRRTVVDRFAEMTDEQTRTREQAVVEAETRAEQIRADLAAQRERIAKDMAEIEPKREKAESEFRSQIAEIDDRERPLLSQLAQLESQAVVVRREALVYAAEVERLERQAEREKEPGERARLRREAERLAFIYRRYESQLLALDREAAGINVQRARLIAQRQQLQAMYQREMAYLQKTVDELRRGEKRIEAEERKLSEPNTGNTPRVREMDRVAKAFTTYEQLPLESERQRILESFR
jgi:hypothetical protein